MEPKEFYRKALHKTEAGNVIEENLLKKTFLVCLDNYRDIIRKKTIDTERERIVNAIKNNCNFKNKRDMQNFIIDLMNRE